MAPTSSLKSLGLLPNPILLLTRKTLLSATSHAEFCSLGSAFTFACICPYSHLRY